MSRDELRESFFLECEDLLEVLDTGLNAISDGTHDDETVNAVFRAVHSIKGGAGAFALDDLVGFAHLFETALDEVRSGRLDMDRALIGLFLRSSDALSDLLAAAHRGEACDPRPIGRIVGDLTGFVGEGEEEEEEEFQPLMLDLGLDQDLVPIDLEAIDLEAIGLEAIGLDAIDPEASEPGPAGAGAGARTFEIRFFPGREFYARGNETTLILRALAEMGTVASACDVSDIPLLGEFDPEDGLCSWSVTLTAGVDGADVADVAELFEFAAEDCQLSIVDVTPAPAADLPDLPPPGPDLDAGLSAPGGDGSGPGAAPGGAAARPPAETERPQDKPRATIRVDLDRVDRLINLVGELVVNQATIAQTLAQGGKSNPSGVKDGLAEFRRLTRDIQESVMAIRAQPVKPLFQRMARIVREAAQATGKEVRLVTDGADTEVDTTVVERLADPLTHMIRNAVDHGLELPAIREAAGKDRQGIVTLSAAHRSGRVVIELSDDGAGIDRARVRQIAVDKDLIDADAVLTDGEIDNLLFLPGFSTAREVSNLSGRGVGMDVVRRSIQALGGRVSIASDPGRGTALTISLPLTLAVLDGIVVRIAGETFVVPLSSVIETLKPHPDETHQLDPTSWALCSRGQVIPVVDAGHELGLRERVAHLGDKVMLVSGNEDGNRTALIIDSVEDQRQVVIKSLETNYGEVPGIAAATILGDGRIGLILDVDILIAGASSAPAARGGKLAMAG